jgi:hypothetical protein
VTAPEVKDCVILEEEFAVIDVTGVCDEIVVVLPYASTCIDGYVYVPGVIVPIVARSNVTTPVVADCVILVFEFAVSDVTADVSEVFALSNAACANAFTVAMFDEMLVLITELADAAFAVIEPFIVFTFAVISPRSVATLAEILVLMTELADTAFAEISPRSVATLAEILVLITELADTALAVISPRSVATLAEMFVFITELADAAFALISPLRVC